MLGEGYTIRVRKAIANQSGRLAPCTQDVQATIPTSLQPRQQNDSPAQGQSRVHPMAAGDTQPRPNSTKRAMVGMITSNTCVWFAEMWDIQTLRQHWPRGRKPTSPLKPGRSSSSYKRHTPAYIIATPPSGYLQAATTQLQKHLSTLCSARPGHFRTSCA